MTLNLCISLEIIAENATPLQKTQNAIVFSKIMKTLIKKEIYTHFFGYLYIFLTINQEEKMQKKNARFNNKN